MSYLPNSLLGLQNWAGNFITAIDGNEAAYGLSVPLMSAFTAVSDAFSEALTLSTNPGTRTPANVADTQTKKDALLVKIYEYVPIIQAVTTITPELLTAAGLTVRKTTRTPVPAPTAVPVLSANRLTSLEITLRVNDVENNSNRFPPNTVGADLYMKTGATPPTSIDGCVFIGRMTKRFFTKTFSGGDANSPVHFIAQYVTRTNKVGPSSAVLSTTVPM